MKKTNKKSSSRRVAAKPKMKEKVKTKKQAKANVKKVVRRAASAVASNVIVAAASKEIVVSGGAAAVMIQTKSILSGALFFDYISKNVGSQANEILAKLIEGPKKDEQVAEILNIKLNEARRMLNLLNNFGVVRYDVNRDSTGWLTFEWRVDHRALEDLNKTINEKQEAKKNTLPDNCNDFFICNSCYKTQKIIYPFDVAFENNFKCVCGKGLGMLNREQAEEVVKS